MNTKEIENSIKTLATKSIGTDAKADDSLKLTQAALNLAHVISVLSNIPKAGGGDDKA